MLISRVTRSTSPLSLILSFSKILIATFSPVIVWVPILTFPNVPEPNERPKKIIDKKIDFLKDNYNWLTDYVVADCTILSFLSGLLCTLARLWSLLLFTVFILTWEVSICVRNSKILVILNVLRPMTWVGSWSTSSILGSCRFLLDRLVLRLATWGRECTSTWQIVLDGSIGCLWSVRRCSGLRNSQSSVIFSVTSGGNLVIRYVVVVVI